VGVQTGGKLGSYPTNGYGKGLATAGMSDAFRALKRLETHIRRVMKGMTSRTATADKGKNKTSAPKDTGKERAATPAAGRSRGADADSLGLFLRDLDHHPLPDHEAQTELAKRVAAGDDEARREMAAANLRLVIHWARRYQDRGVDLPDLIQEGTFGLMRAVDKFDWERGFRFSTYATWWIRQALQRAVQQHGRTIRLPMEVAHRRRVGQRHQHHRRHAGRPRPGGPGGSQPRPARHH
jgi:DNA-directed RNA polymerase sigma subunit (sigma70/sigma32)